ncbi:hypothetical protein BD560DRAFT_387485 [Blakeslea trispora]|nr:hypothetical protein BD560DRAFT_387485 [Blakeslea trispora]
MASFMDGQDMGMKMSSKFVVRAIEEVATTKYQSLPSEVDISKSLNRKSVTDQESVYHDKSAGETYPMHSIMTTESISYNISDYRDYNKIKALQEKIQQLDHQTDEPNLCIILLCGISSYTMSTNAILERRVIEKTIEAELSKPLDPLAPEAPGADLEGCYQDAKKIADLQYKIQALEENRNRDRCCYFCYGSSAVAYTSYRLTKLQDLRYQLEKEIEKPLKIQQE